MWSAWQPIVRAGTTRSGILQVTRRHWAGDLPLWASFWAIGLVVVCLQRLLGLSLEVIAQKALTEQFRLYFAPALIVVGAGLSFVLLSWWLVGAWRATSYGSSSAMKSAIIVGHRAAIISFGTAVMAAYAFVLVPQFLDSISDLREDPQWGARGVRLSDNGKFIEVYGHITRSVTTSLEDALASRGHRAIVVLNSIGGRSNAALKMHNIIMAHGADTLVTGHCESACTIAFLGGRRRLVTPSARLGFHSAAIVGLPSNVTNEMLKKEELKWGISTQFLAKAFSTRPNEMWYPTTDELEQAHVITHLIPESDVASSGQKE